MALITLVSPYGSFRGRDSVSAGGVLFPRGGRNFRRTFVQPANPNTSFQQVVRSAMAEASQGFSQLADNDLPGWQTLADALPRTDPNGNSFILQPKQWYVSVNTYRLLDGQALLDTAPAATSPLSFGTLTSLVYSVGPPQLIDLTFTNSAGPRLFFIESTAPLPGVRRQPRDTDFRSWAILFPDAIVPRSASPQTEQLNIDTQARIAYQVGDRVGIRMTAISDDYVKGQVRSEVITVT